MHADQELDRWPEETASTGASADLQRHKRRVHA